MSIYIHLCSHLQTSELEFLVGTALSVMLSFYLAFVSLLVSLVFQFFIEHAFCSKVVYRHGMR